MTAQLPLFDTKPEPVDLLDWRHAERVLAREHEDRLSGPPARPCRCSRPWPLEEGRCVRCGREVRPS